MSKKILKYFIFISPIIFSPLVVSCIKYPNDNEDLEFHENILNNKQKEEIVIKNKDTQKIKTLYEENVLNIFIEVKAIYRQFRNQYYKLIKKAQSLKNKLPELVLDQGDEENKTQIQKFYDKWFQTNESNPKLATTLKKYELIFVDVDVVLSDVNLVFDNLQFLKSLKIIDQRLSGIDITLGQEQSEIIAAWNFLKLNLFNKNKITTLNDLQNVNIESEKNSHNHSHAIINLIYELSLWHNILKKEITNEINLFVNDFEIMKQNVIDNIGQKNFQNDYDEIIKIFNLIKNSDQENSLINQELINKTEETINKIKTLLNKIAQEQGILNQVNLD
ncbi:hypothetical protein N8G13_02020 [Mycoplasma zalophi]|uniref:HxHSH motif-containing lipoprotein n=1 Tax=Mycoplasma zalophi TaxID=191287 RepID=UPI0021CADB21|nr:hypothetical protein [Mycoplasma zalophi]MCU4117231.1 hypothetical protein [Mycoplasma zalophi]